MVLINLSTADGAILAALNVSGNLNDVEYGWSVYKMAVVTALRVNGMNFLANAMSRNDYETFNIELVDERNNERKIIC